VFEGVVHVLDPIESRLSHQRHGYRLAVSGLRNDTIPRLAAWPSVPGVTVAENRNTN